MREAHIPAQQPEAEEDARLSPADANPRGPSGAEVPPPAGPQAPRGLIWRVRDRGTFEALGRATSRAVGPIRVRVVEVEGGAARVAYSVGRGVGNAVERNRLRRRLRAEVWRHREQLRPGSAYLFSAGPRASSMTPEALSATVLELLVAGNRS
jgi:ribonuclease P protein component